MARLSLGWLKPPKVPDDGVMSLGDHLREFRYRVVASVIVVVLGMILCAIFYQQILGFMLQPYNKTVLILSKTHPTMDVQGVLSDSFSPIILVLRVVGISALAFTSPIWLYQVWAYLRPALLQHEKRYAMLFIGAAVPLFLGGCILAYFVLPEGVAVLMSFTPQQVQITNLLNIDSFIALLVQLMLIFGLGFLLPLIVVALNLVGVVSGAALKRARKFVIFGCFLFAAMFTPGGDPISMLALSVPMMALFLVAEGLCHVTDRRRAKRLAAAEAADEAERAARLEAIQQ